MNDNGINIIEMENVSHRFQDGTLGVDRVSLQIERGAFVVVAGANGSGKTTLLRHLNGLLLPTEGKVAVGGSMVSGNLKRARRLVGMVFQDADSQIVGETVYDDVAFGPENLRLNRDEVNSRVQAAIKTVGLNKLNARPTHFLSGGEKRRLSIAGVLAMEPEVVVFDEPFTSLDYPGVKQVLEQMLRLHSSGITILVSTHDLEKVIYYADRLILMENGRIAKDGPPHQVMQYSEAYGVRTPCFTKLGMELKPWLG
jgi:biotin transport system ATP-binding protein